MIVAAAGVAASVAAAVWTGHDGQGRITRAELRGYPPIALVWAKRRRASYTGSGDLYVVRADGTGLHRLKAWPELAYKNGLVYGTRDARWSPDHKLILLPLTVWWDDPDEQVAVLSANGDRVRTVGPGSQVEGAAWSRDGHALLWWNGYREELWSVSNGGRLRRVWRREHDFSNGLWDADWAPSGRYFAASKGRGIVRVGRDGASVIRLTHFGESPRWSPDGREIAFVRRRGERGEIYVVGADGRGLRRVASIATAPLWSRDGRSIFFTTNSGIGVARLDDTRPRRLTSDSTDRAIGLSPDGSKILFFRHDELWVMDAVGTRQTRLLSNRPRWSFVSADWGR